MDFSVADYQCMSRALQLAGKGLYTTDPNPRVGCVIVKDGEIVGEGWHQYAGEPHAEIHALRQAGRQAESATVYVTLEPCSHHGRTPPCAEALIKAGVSKVIAAMEDPNPEVAGTGFKLLQQAGIATSSGLLEKEAKVLNPGFCKRMMMNRPYVRLKLGVSLDGRTAMASGESRWVTGEAARKDVHRLRARSSAVITGMGTVVHDDPSLTVRLEETDFPGDAKWDGRQPLRVIVDADHGVPVNAKMFTLPGETIIATNVQQEGRHGYPVEVISLPATENAVNLDTLLEALANRGVNEVLVESGATLAGAFIEQGLVDELVVYMASHIMGNRARGMFNLPGLEQMGDRIALELDHVSQVGGDLRLQYRPVVMGE